MLYHIAGFFSGRGGGGIFMVLVVEKQTTKYLPTKVNYMKCATLIHAYTWLHARSHIVDQRVLDSVWPYFDTSRGKRTTYRSSWPFSTICVINFQLQLPTRLFLALKLFPKFTIPIPMYWWVPSYYGLNFEAWHLYTSCVRGCGLD